MNTHILSLTALALTVGASQGVTITYVDAVVAGMSGTANTTGPVGTVNSATAWQIRGLNGGPATDVNNFSNGGSALQYNTNPINAANPTLVTSVTGLNPLSTYRAYVFFWDDGLVSATPAFVPATSATAWDVNAKLSTDATYSAFNSTDAGGSYIVTTDAGTVGGVTPTGAYTSLTFSEVIGLNVLGQAADTYVDAYDGNRTLFAAALPTLVSGVSSFSVDVQAGTFNAQRSWYDGVGYELISTVPEPSSALLGGLAAACLLRRRR